jgi:tRNA-2-methylthio-N6-dimethylallyladenosine synthase
MFADGEGRKDSVTSRMSGRARDNRLVHVTVPDHPSVRPRPGDLADVVVTYAAPHHLNADAGVQHLRRTPGGDAWQARQGVAADASRQPVQLGLPTMGLPASSPPALACG